MSQDLILECADCSTQFTFTAKEQEFYNDKGYSQPRRCAECRKARRNANGGDRVTSVNTARPGSERQLFDAVCARCGNDTKVPFQPRGDKPIFCRDCFQAQR